MLPFAYLALFLISGGLSINHFLIRPRRWMKKHGETGLYGRSLLNKRASDSIRAEKAAKEKRLAESN